jgi:hypothetical protein
MEMRQNVLDEPQELAGTLRVVDGDYRADFWIAGERMAYVSRDLADVLATVRAFKVIYGEAK